MLINNHNRVSTNFGSINVKVGSKKVQEKAFEVLKAKLITHNKYTFDIKTLDVLRGSLDFSDLKNLDKLMGRQDTERGSGVIWNIRVKNIDKKNNKLTVEQMNEIDNKICGIVNNDCKLEAQVIKDNKEHEPFFDFDQISTSLDKLI